MKRYRKKQHFQVIILEAVAPLDLGKQRRSVAAGQGNRCGVYVADLDPPVELTS